jgi:hypothetical protein
MNSDKAFLRHCDFTLSHCFKGETCPKWRADYVTEYCGDNDMMIDKFKCTRFKEEER